MGMDPVAETQQCSTRNQYETYILGGQKWGKVSENGDDAPQIRGTCGNPDALNDQVGFDILIFRPNDLSNTQMGLSENTNLPIEMAIWWPNFQGLLHYLFTILQMGVS